MPPRPHTGLAPGGRIFGLALGLLAAGCDDKAGDSGGGGANLQVVSVVCTQESSGADCNVVVENTGDEGAGSFSIGIYAGAEPAVGDAAADSATVDSLAAGDIQGVTLFLAGCTGCTVWALADNRGDVDESFEDDNTASTTPARRRR